MPFFGMHSARQVVPVVAHDIALRGHLDACAACTESSLLWVERDTQGEPMACVEGRRIWEARNKALLSLPVVTMGEYLLNNPVFGATHVGHL